MASTREENVTATIIQQLRIKDQLIASLTKRCEELTADTNKQNQLIKEGDKEKQKMYRYLGERNRYYAEVQSLRREVQALKRELLLQKPNVKKERRETDKGLANLSRGQSLRCSREDTRSENSTILGNSSFFLDIENTTSRTLEGHSSLMLNEDTRVRPILKHGGNRSFSASSVLDSGAMKRGEADTPTITGVEDKNEDLDLKKNIGPETPEEETEEIVPTEAKVACESVKVPEVEDIVTETGDVHEDQGDGGTNSLVKIPSADPETMVSTTLQSNLDHTNLDHVPHYQIVSRLGESAVSFNRNETLLSDHRTSTPKKCVLPPLSPIHGTVGGQTPQKEEFESKNQKHKKAYKFDEDNLVKLFEYCRVHECLWNQSFDWPTGTPRARITKPLYEEFCAKIGWPKEEHERVATAFRDGKSKFGALTDRVQLAGVYLHGVVYGHGRYRKVLHVRTSVQQQLVQEKKAKTE